MKARNSSLAALLAMLVAGGPLPAPESGFSHSARFTGDRQLAIDPADAAGWYFILHGSASPAGEYAALAMNEGGFLLPVGAGASFYLMSRHDPSAPGDWDGDGIDDLFEIRHPPMDPVLDDAGGNYDTDSLTNLQEYQLGTHPGRGDTDGDGVGDDDEVAAQTNPLNPQDLPLNPNGRPRTVACLVSSLNSTRPGEPDALPSTAAGALASVINGLAPGVAGQVPGHTSTALVSALNQPVPGDPDARARQCASPPVSVANQAGQ